MADKKKKPTKFKFKYVIPDHIKDCYVNGAWGGLTPRGEIHMHPYSERHPIPLETTHTILKSGSMSKTAKVTAGGDVIRLVQSSLLFDLNTAIALRDWLNGMINAIEDQKTTKKKG